MAEYKMRVKSSDPELSSVLYYPPALALFEAFSVKEIATESLFFWKAVEYFDDLCERLDRTVEKQKQRAVVAGSSSSGAAAGAAPGAGGGGGERVSMRVSGRGGGSSGGKVRWQPALESGPMQVGLMHAHIYATRVDGHFLTFSAATNNLASPPSSPPANLFCR